MHNIQVVIHPSESPSAADASSRQFAPSLASLGGCQCNLFAV
jgi:hypothetical protein